MEFANFIRKPKLSFWLSTPIMFSSSPSSSPFKAPSSPFQGAFSQGLGNLGSVEIGCLSCQKKYQSRDAAICKNCYKNVRETEKKLMSQIENLNSTVTFLRSSSSVPPPPFSDVVLVAADDSSRKPIPANRAILASRSPVFRAMLENEMDESISGTIKISEVSHDALRMFVSFLHTAEAILDSKLAFDLLVLAEKYEVPHLKSHCEKFLRSVLTWHNSLQIYAFARQHNSHSLVDESLSLILENMQKIARGKDYAQLAETDPRLVLQIYEAYIFQHSH